MASKREREQREVRKTNAKEWAEKQAQGFEPTAIKLPEGLKVYKLEEGTHLFDIMPFIAGKGNKRADEGYQHFEREYAVHKIPRPDGNFDRYCCLYETFGEPCPVCKWRNERTRDKEESDALRPQVRHLFLVNDKPGDPKNPFKVMDAVHYNRKLGFGEQLVTAIRATRGGENLADLDRGGKTIQVIVADSKYGSVSRIDLLPRDYEYPNSLLEKAPCLDDCVIKPKVSVLNNILEQGSAAPENSEDEEDSDSRNGKAATSKVKAKDEDEDEEEEDDDDEDSKAEPTAEDLGLEKGDVVLYKGDRCEITKVSGDGTSLTLEDEDGTVHKAIAPAKVKKVAKPADDDEDEDEEEEDDEDAPPPKKGAKAETKPGKKKPVDDDDDDDEEEDDDSDDEDDEDDEPPAKAKKGGKKVVDEDDDDDDEDPLEDEDDDDDDEPPQRGKKPATRSRKTG